LANICETLAAAFVGMLKFIVTIFFLMMMSLMIRLKKGHPDNGMAFSKNNKK
jgi:hypothetical protein